jgi:hypothetical protein
VTKEFLVAPLHGVDPVRLGMSREAVCAAFGPPSNSFYKTPDSRYPTDAWFENEFQVFYEGDEPTVAYIELSSGANVEAVLFGLPVFATSIPALISEIELRAELDKTDPELGYSYVFPSLELAFWRPYMEDEEAPYFATVGITVGIGVPGYLSA